LNNVNKYNLFWYIKHHNKLINIIIVILCLSTFSTDLIAQQDTIYNQLNVPIDTSFSVGEEEDGMFASWDNVEIDPYNYKITSDFQPLYMTLIDPQKGEEFVMPHDGVVTSHFGWRWHRAHKGTDIDCVTGDIIRSCLGGVVRVARYHSGYGYLVIVRHQDGLETFYAHLSTLLVSEGDHVYAGTEVGLGGNTGHSTGSHLHFEMRYKGNAFDTRKVIDYSSRTLHSNNIVIDKSFFKIVNPPAPKPSTASTQDITEAVYHTVKKGETIKAIATKYKVSEASLYKLNHMTSKSILKIGRRLRIL